MKTATIILLPNKYHSGTTAVKGDKLIDAIGVAKEKKRAGLELMAEQAILSQAKDVDIKVEIRKGDDIILPRITTDCAIILDEASFLPPDYLEKVNAALSFFPSAILCGPIKNKIVGKTEGWFQEDISSFYKSYRIPMYSARAINIADDLNLYPSLFNTIFPAKIFNEIGGYNPIRGTKLGVIYNNRLMITSAVEAHKDNELVYCENLDISYYYHKDEFAHNTMLKHFYQCGYIDGAIQPEEKVEDIVWQKYVNNSERFDYSMPVWVAMKDNIKEEEKKKEYAHKLAAFRTIYNLGFFEGLEGSSLI